MATLSAKHVTKLFPGRVRGQQPVRALDDVNIEVSGSQFVSIVGPSGCGKSTLLNIISGVDIPSSGKVSITEAGRPARLGYVFQEPRLLPWRTIIENMLYVHDDSGAERRESVRRHLKMVKLDDVESLYPNQLSGGMQQRAGIARAFSVEPDLLLMDEPFSHLDAITARSLREQLQELLAVRPTTVLFVSHDVMEAVQLSDRIVVLAPGGVVHSDIPIDLPRPRRATDTTVATMQASILERFEAM